VLVSERDGADIALELALEHPDRVAGLALVAPSLRGFWPSAWPKPEAWLNRPSDAASAAALPRRGAAATARPLVQDALGVLAAIRLLVRDLRGASRAHRRFLRIWAHNVARMLGYYLVPPRSRARRWRLFDPSGAGYAPHRLDPPPFRRLAEIRAPTLLVFGEPMGEVQAELAQAQAELAQALRDGIERAQLVAMPVAGSCLPLEAPGAFTPTLLAFVRTVYADGTNGPRGA